MAEIPTHFHNGLDSPKVSPKNLKGFQVLDVAPTHQALPGTLLLAHIGANYYLYAYLNNVWVKVQLS